MFKRLLACLAISVCLIQHAVAQVTFSAPQTCSQVTLSNGNLTAAFVAPDANGYIAQVNALIASGSRVYFEFVNVNGYTGTPSNGSLQVGVQNVLYPAPTCGTLNFPGGGFANSGNGFIEDQLGRFVSSGVFSNTFAPWPNVGDNISLAVDLANNKVWFRVNGGNWNNDASQNPATNTGGVNIAAVPFGNFGVTPMVNFRNNGGGTLTGHFASASWTYAAPAGFSQLSLPPTRGVIAPGNQLSGGTSTGLSNGVAGGMGCIGNTCANAVVYNLATDFGGVCNGITDAAPFFAAARNTIVNDPRVIAGSNVVLVVPGASNCSLQSCPFGPFAEGMNDFTLVASGATFTNVGGAACEQWGYGNLGAKNVGGRGNVGQAEQPIATVSAGASCVTMQTVTDATMYTVGNWAMIGALGYQGNGYPPNFALWEYLKVASTNGSTGAVCFTTALVNSYKSTWTDLGDQNCSGWACGGNPRLFNMDASWGHIWHEIGGTWNWPASYPVEFVAQNVIVDNVTFNGSGNGPNCMTPTISQNVTYNSVVNTNCTVDADKMVQNWTINNSTLSSLNFQTTSFLNLTLNNTTMAFLNLGPQNTSCNNSTINGIFVGANNYGTEVNFAGNGCVIQSANTHPLGMSFQNPGECSATGAHTFCRLFSMTAGVIELQNTGFNTGVPPTWWLPGTVMYFGGANAIEGFTWTVGDNNCTGGAGGSAGCLGGIVFVNTSLAGGFPPVQSDPSFGIEIFPDIVRNWSCVSCTGSAIARDLSQAGAQNAPLFSYSSRTYTCTNNLVNVPGASDLNAVQDYGAWGNFGTVTINVSQADTGPNGTLTFGTDQFGRINFTNQSTGANGFWGYAVNLKIAGTRTITATTLTGNQTGDSGTFPGANTMLTSVIGTGGGIQAFTSANLTTEPAAQCPVVTLTYALTR